MRQRLRKIRRSAQDKVKKGKDGKLGPGISEDEAFKVGSDIDKLTQEYNKILDDMVATKQTSVLSV